MKVERSGIWYAVAAYIAWGLFPIYWSFLKAVPSFEILAHRIIWSFAFYFLLLLSIKKSFTFTFLKEGFKKSFQLLGCALMISSNWWLYIWAVNNGHVLESSLGYFINPLVNIFLGYVFLKERLNRLESLALIFAVIGVGYLAFHSTSGIPWIALTLASTFGIYGLLRKTLELETLVGSTLETFMLLPAGLIPLLDLPGLYHSQFGFHQLSEYSPTLLLLLIAGGAVTSIPLLFFSEASKRLPLGTLGFFQYIAPTLQFLCAVFFFNESFTLVYAVSFGFIWIAVAMNLLNQYLKFASATTSPLHTQK